MINAELAQTIAMIRQSGGTYEPSSELINLTLAEAYEIQSRLADTLVAGGQFGGIAGYKLAVNGPAQMAHFGVTEPAAAFLFEREAVRSPAELAAGSFANLVIEPEIAAIIGAGIDDVGETLDRDDVAKAIEKFVPALELIDMRGLKMPDVTLPAAVALNVLNAGCVIGDDGVRPADLNLTDMTATLLFDGKPVASGTNAAPQHPLDAVTWLIGHLRQRSLALQPGMIVLCGTHVPMQKAPEGTRDIEATFSGLGEVALRLE